jgi:protease-4
MKSIGRFLLWLFAGVGAVFIAVIAAVVVFSSSVRDDAPSLPETAVLWLDWNVPLAERQATLPLLQAQAPVTVLGTLRALERAAERDEVKALAVTLGEAPLSFARAQELADAVRRFRESGKPAYAFSTDLGGFGDGTPEILLAASFDEIWLQPSGLVGFTGVALEIPYAAEALDEIGLRPQFEQRHEFKGGSDPLTRRGMPPPVRASLKAVVDELAAQTVASVAADRGLPEDRVRALLDGGPYLGREALDAGLIDRLDYEHAFRDHVADAAGGEFEWIGPALLNAAEPPEDTPTEEPQARIAVLYGLGPIGVDEDGGAFSDPGFDATGLIETLDRLVEEESHDAVLLRVDSPGGAYGPSDAVWNAVRRTREAGIPVVVSMAEVAASGGYFVSVAADRIVAAPGTLTGSIGVYGGKISAAELWEDLGISWGEVAAGENAGMWSFNRPFDAEERARFATTIDFVYEDFTAKVAQGRGFDATTLNAVARGRIWTGADALGAGLVDALGGFDTALQQVRELLELEADAPLTLEILPEPEPAWQKILEAVQDGDLPGLVGATVAAEAERRIAERVEARLGPLDALRPNPGLLSLPPLRHSRGAPAR